MQKHLTSKQIVQLSGLVLVDAVVFGTTNPQETPSYMLIVGFLLFCATVYYIFRAMIAILGVYGVKIRHRQRLLRTMTALTAGMVALQSIGQLAPRDVLVLLLLAVLLYVYMAYAKNLKQSPADKRPQL